MYRVAGLNYQRGFKRLFAVIAVCWMAFWLWAASQSPPQSYTLIIIAFAVPAAGYALFFTVVPWIARGFKS